MKLTHDTAHVPSCLSAQTCQFPRDQNRENPDHNRKNPDQNRENPTKIGKINRSTCFVPCGPGMLCWPYMFWDVISTTTWDGKVCAAKSAKSKRLASLRRPDEGKLHVFRTKSNCRFQLLFGRRVGRHLHCRRTNMALTGLKRLARRTIISFTLPQSWGYGKLQSQHRVDFTLVLKVRIDCNDNIGKSGSLHWLAMTSAHHTAHKRIQTLPKMDPSRICTGLKKLRTIYIWIVVFLKQHAYSRTTASKYVRLYAQIVR